MVEPNNASSRLLKTSESYGLYLASAINTSSTITKSRSSIGKLISLGEVICNLEINSMHGLHSNWMTFLLLLVIQASNTPITTTQADIGFSDSNDAMFVNATFSASDASILIPGSLLLERGNNGIIDNNLK